MADSGLYIGTSGYSYAEWIDSGFYPPGIRSAEMLNYYAGRFFAAELNYTWYQMPRASTVEKMCLRLPENFLVSAKLTRTMTHEVDNRGWKAQAGLYKEGISPLAETGKLVAILIQLPPSFKWTVKNRHYLASLLDEFADFPLAVEFRHCSWAKPSVYKELSRRNAALVNVDVPDLDYLFQPGNEVTCPDLFYLRLHGRNRSGWNSGNMQDQFNYDYTGDELSSLVKSTIRPMAKKAAAGCIFFNNHVAAQAPRNAERLISLLKKGGISTTGGNTGKFK
ncbi:MAG: DUF72 domain-containing protein [Desulfobacteraceae bacterium]